MTKYEQKYPISSQKVQVDINVIRKLMKDFERGKNSTLMMRNIILQNYSIVKLEDSSNNNNKKNDYVKALNHHSKVALDTFVNSISMLKSCDFVDGFVDKSKLSDHLDHHPCKSEVSSYQESPKGYKKRKIGGESKEIEVTRLTDDGYAWRKYGQKNIHDYIYPRHYFRCTHKHEQKCQATKQVQQISENPTKYKVIYHDNHTCNNNILNNSSYMISSPDEHSSAFVLSFDGSNPINPIMFPESTFHIAISDVNDMKIPKTSEASSSNTVSEQSEHTSIVVAENNNSSSLSSSSATSVNLDEDYNPFMVAFSELFPDWRTSF